MTKNRLFNIAAGLRGAMTLLFLCTASVTVVRADAVTDWNALMQSTVAPLNPFAQARSAAIVQLAVFEAVNSITGKYEPYLAAIPAPAGASAEAAAIAAAYLALATLHPDSGAELEAAAARSLASMPDGTAKNDGIQVGEAAAALLLELRSDDGSTSMAPYTPGTEPGDWQPTPPAFAPAILPHWGQVRTFGVQSGSQFRSQPPPALNTGKYARHLQEVQEAGQVTSSARPPDRTDVAHFYITGAVQFYNPAARQVSAAQGRTLSENARIFALLAVAVCDALISCMETKFYYDYWRPVTAIVNADLDGNSKTFQDLAWLPLIVTPPFPSYPSAHASAGGAARKILEHFFGEDGHFITLISPTAAGMTLVYTSFEQITDDVDDARIYGGIHFRFDQEAGAAQGRRIGAYILRNLLRKVSGPKAGHGH